MRDLAGIKVVIRTLF